MRKRRGPEDLDAFDVTALRTQFFEGVVVPPAAPPLHDCFVPAPAPLHELFALDSGAAEPAPVGVVDPLAVPLSPPHPASRPTKMPEAAVTARVLPIFMSFSSCLSPWRIQGYLESRGHEGPREVRA